MLESHPSFYIRTRLLGLVLALFVTGCASTAPSSQSPNEQDASSLALTSEEVHQRILQAADRWANVPHRLGGTSLQGVDCSALVQAVFEEELSLQLPRTTERQVQVGKRIDRSSLEPGDLVFFRPTRHDNHVGIYLSDGQFLHASESEGVTTSSLQSEYWTERWWQARRVFSLSSERTADSLSPSSSSPRTGW